MWLRIGTQGLQPSAIASWSYDEDVHARLGEIFVAAEVLPKKSGNREAGASIKVRPRAEQTHASPSRRAQLPEAHALAAQQRGLDLRHV